MGSRRVTLFAVVTAIILLIALLLSTYSLWLRGGPTPIVLPTTPVTFIPIEENTAIPSPTEQPFSPVEIDSQNVQNALATLHRCSQYSADYRLTRSYYASSTTTLRKVFRRDQLLACEFYTAAGALEKSLVTDGDICYYWFAGQTAVIQRPMGNASYDSLQNIPTYEALLSLDPAQIQDARYSAQDGADCITVVTVDQETNYRDTYEISISSGLLLRFSREKEGKQTILLEMTGFSPASPEDASFSLPSGQFPF